MKFVFVNEYYPPHIGGVEIVFSELAQRLVKLGHDCSVITCQVPNTKAYQEIDGVKVHRVRVPQRGDRYWFAFLAIPKVLRLAKSADLIQATTFTGAFPAWLAAKLLRKKCVLTVHEVWGPSWQTLTEFNWFYSRLHWFLEKLIVSLPFNKYVCVSNHTRNSLKSAGIEDEKILVIYNGIDEAMVASTSDAAAKRRELGLGNDFIYMFYGRPGISKGLEYLIQATPTILERIPNSRLLLILANEPRNRYHSIKAMIKDLAVDNKIIMLDPVPRNELPGYIAAADCVVVPSLSEGFGFTVAEACALGRPVVASNVASLPEVISGRYVLVEPRNPGAIAEGVEKVFKGEVENSKRKVFSWDECTRKYLQVYLELTRRNEYPGCI